MNDEEKKKYEAEVREEVARFEKRFNLKVVKAGTHKCNQAAFEMSYLASIMQTRGHMHGLHVVAADLKPAAEPQPICPQCISNLGHDLTRLAGGLFDLAEDVADIVYGEEDEAARAKKNETHH